MNADQEAAALWGWATNQGVPLDERLAAALQALDYYGGDDWVRHERGTGWDRAHTMLCSDIYPQCQHRNPWMKAIA